MSHETTIAKKIVEEAKKHGNVKAIKIEYGEASRPKPEPLEKALKSLAKWKITMKKLPVKIRCLCGYRGKPKIVERTHFVVLLCCPKCGSRSVGVPSGGTINLHEVVTDKGRKVVDKTIRL
jgi:Zn finger protein HypA/HybF involved in hydrogenase expression